MMKNKLLIFTLFLLSMGQGHAQVGIGTPTPNAALDIVSKDSSATTKALAVKNSDGTELLTVTSNGRVGINAPTPETSALLELKSTNQALLLTRVANTAAIANPVNGMILYDISANYIKAYENNAWTACLSN